MREGLTSLIQFSCILESISQDSHLILCLKRSQMISLSFCQWLRPCKKIVTILWFPNSILEISRTQKIHTEVVHSFNNRQHSFLSIASYLCAVGCSGRCWDKKNQDHRKINMEQDKQPPSHSAHSQPFLHPSFTHFYSHCSSHAS